MSKKAKIIILISATLLVALTGIFCVEYFVLQAPVFSRSGWSTLKSGSICYRDYYAKPLIGWQQLDGKSYYFDLDGAMHTGWLEVGEKRYYFSDEGVLQTGAIKLEGKDYFLNEDGTPYTGWLEGAYYGADGARHTGWLELPEGKYLLDESGKPRTGWVGECGRRYYFKENGIQDTRWQDSEEGLQYIVDGQPYIGWLEEAGGKFCFDEKGYSQAGWVTNEKGRFFLYGDGSFATGFVTIADIERYFLPTGEYVLLCNRWNYVPDDYEMNLVPIGKFKVDASCAIQLQQMMDDGKAAGFNVKINNSYRSKKTQEGMWETRRVKYMGQGMTLAEANAYIGRSVAVPGTSEHQTGLGIDITGSDKMYKWLAENCWKYGFILRYPDDKMDVTGIIYEPWHFRYVGESMAKDIYDSGLCLEEYLEMLKTQ